MSSSKKISDRLVQSVREARKTSGKQASTSGAKSVRPTPASRSPAVRPAAEFIQSPSENLDQPWQDLHPARVWPD